MPFYAPPLVVLLPLTRRFFGQYFMLALFRPLGCFIYYCPLLLYLPTLLFVLTNITYSQNSTTPTVDTDKRSTKPPKNHDKSIPPSCRRAGVQTARELLAEENMLMDLDFETTTNKETPFTKDAEKPNKTPTTPTSEDGEGITPYQRPPRDPSPSGTSVLSEELPNHVYEDLCGYWRSYSYFHSRVRIFEGFATDGPFPTITSLQFQEDPQTGLTRKYSEELNEATRNFKEKICNIHARNFEHLATNELMKIKTLTTEATNIYGESVVKDTLQRARAHAFNKAREIKRLKKHNKNRRNNASREAHKRIRSPSRSRSCERKQRNKRD